MKIGLTLTSSLEVGEEYIELTRQVATTLAKQNFGIVYGGTAYGMMSALAESYKQAGGSDLTGVMAKDLMQVTKNYKAYDKLDNSFLEDTMADRTRRIIELSDAFIILPGGYGSLEEIGAVLGGKANKIYDKPIAFYNYNGFYDTFLSFLREMQTKRFSKIPVEHLAPSMHDLDEILEYFKNYQKHELTDKFVH